MVIFATKIYSNRHHLHPNFKPFKRSPDSPKKLFSWKCKKVAQTGLSDNTLKFVCVELISF